MQPGSRHLFVFVQHARGEDWWAFDLDTGRRLAAGLRLDRSVECPEVVGDRVFYLSLGETDYGRGMTPRRLKCVSLRTRKVLWQRAVAGLPSYPPRP